MIREINESPPPPPPPPPLPPLEGQRVATHRTSR